MPALYSQSIESLAPVYNVTCADAAAQYTAKKGQRASPENSLDEASKLTDCLLLSASKIKDTPCDEIRLAYALCLKGGSRVSCKALKSQLEECTAKHLGKLD